MIAAAETLTAWIEDKKLSELHGLQDVELLQTISGELGGFPADRTQCMEIVFEALRARLAEYRIHRIEEFRGEKAAYLHVLWRDRGDGR